MNRLMAIGGILVMLVGLAVLVLPSGRIPLLDANRTILTETEREAYCAGLIYLQTRGQGDAAAAADCRATSAKPDQIDLDAVQSSFCHAVITQMNLTHGDCLGIMSAQRFWPTMDGGITNSWNRRFPYPGGVIVKDTDDSRTGSRTPTTNGGFAR